MKTAPMAADEVRLRTEWPWLTALVVAQALVTLLIWPQGEFPLNDDWSFARAVKHLVDGQGWLFTGWNDMTLVFQVLWGAAFCKLLGFSHLVLRLSTLTLAVSGALCLYLLARELGVTRWLSLLAGLALIGNPWWVILAHSFMSDVPFTALVIVATYLVVAGARRRQAGLLILSSAVASLALLIRQVGALIPIGALPGVVVAGKKRAMWQWADLARLFVLPACVLLALPIMAAHIGNFGLGGVSVRQMPERLARTPTWTFDTIAYVGVFAFPLLPAGVAALVRRRDRIELLAAAGTFALCLAGALRRFRLYGGLMPYLPNIVTVYGSFRENEVLAGARDAVLQPVAQAAVTGVSLLGAALFAACIVGLLRREEERGKLIAIPVGIALFQWLPTLISRNHYDRYLLPLLPIVAVVIAMYAARRGPGARVTAIVGGVLLLAQMGWGALVTQNEFAVRRAAWVEANALVSQGVPPSSIDAGFEWHGWHYRLPVRGDQVRPSSNPLPAYEPLPAYLSSVFVEDRPDYVISTSPLFTIQFVKELPCPSLLAPRQVLYLSRAPRP